MDKKKILVIDDDYGTRELLESTFSDFDEYEVLKAIDAQTGWSLLEQKPDLILVDIMMPTLDGYEFIRKVRNIGPDKKVRIMVLTAKHQEEDMQEAIKAGADEFITKPFDLDFLQKRVMVQLLHPELLPEEDEINRYNRTLHFVKRKEK